MPATAFTKTLLFAAACCAGGACLANDYQTVVRAQLGAIKAIGEGEGFRQAFDDHFDLLGNRASDEYTFELKSGREYFIAAVCDQDCSDLDLKLHDENGKLIAEDDLVDDAPIVRVTPRWSGRFTLTVTMFDCSSAPCHYGISVLGR
jgi:hypothetical protein